MLRLHAALKARAVLENQPSGQNLARHRRVGPQVHIVGRHQLARDAAEHRDVVGDHVALHVTRLGQHDRILFAEHGAFDAPFEDDRFLGP